MDVKRQLVFQYIFEEAVEPVEVIEYKYPVFVFIPFIYLRGLVYFRRGTDDVDGVEYLCLAPVEFSPSRRLTTSKLDYLPLRTFMMSRHTLGMGGTRTLVDWARKGGAGEGVSDF